MSLNAVVTDYVPRGIMRSAARVGVLGSSVAAGAGLMLLAVVRGGVLCQTRTLRALLGSLGTMWAPDSLAERPRPDRDAQEAVEVS